MQVRKIPVTRTMARVQPIIARKNVAAYARVSTDRDEQQTSYETQVSYYENMIRERADWNFVNVYTDEGISGTSTAHREGFKQMIQDALDHKIDLIITKSVSPVSYTHLTLPTKLEV